MRVTVPNDQDPLRAGPTGQRLAWEEPEPLVRSEPTKRARDEDAWAEVCPATSHESGQLIGRVGTPEEPLFTYEQAVHFRKGQDDLLLVVGADIPTEERHHLSEATINALTKQLNDVEAHRLPRLPRGVVPKGWDRWGRPWALMDCPVTKVPRIDSQHGSDRVTVAVLVNFPPEPFYFPDVNALDYTLRCRSKAGKKGTPTCGLSLEKDGQWKDPAGTYKKLKLSTYQHCVPAQEMLRSHRWTSFREGHWGNRHNPQIPAGDVRPVGAATEEPARPDDIELPPTAAPESPVIARSVSSAAHSSSQTIVLSSDREEAAQEDMELTVPASPPRTVAPRQTSSQAQVAQAVTTMVTQIRKTGATSSTDASAQRDGPASGLSMTDPPAIRIPRVAAAEPNPPRASGSSHSRTSHRDRSRQGRQPVFPPDFHAVRWTAPGATPRWKAKEPESVADMEASARQVARGASDTTWDHAIQHMERFGNRFSEDLKLCMQEMREARNSAATTGPPGPTRHLMGQVQGLWERAEHQESSIARTSWEQKLSSRQGIGSPLRSRTSVLWCSQEHKPLDITSYKQSPLGRKVSSSRILLCYIFIYDTGCAWYGLYHWNF